MAGRLAVLLMVAGMVFSLSGCVSSTDTPQPTQTVANTSTPSPNPTPPIVREATATPTVSLETVANASTPSPSPTPPIVREATATPTVSLEDEIYVQFNGKAKYRSVGSRTSNETPSIPLKGYHLEGGFLCYFFERTPDGPEYNGWPGWSLWFSRERPNGNVSSSALVYELPIDYHQDCFAVGWGHGDDRPDRRSTSPRYRNFFIVEKPEGSWVLTVCTSRVDLTGKVYNLTASGHWYSTGKKDFECPSPDG